ncbi:hypothetical protein [Synechococcus sp. WH 8016]|uniref:hypothetical protein n=1 Tax=Synechococcus sp. WH 8016 TaxID=166318 RepID=UPI00022D9B72|nr:hypothetical protein [Synechococcus sp. WH 8016]EHA63055.1 hypothetical protein Syn8016DRAFT_0096 [Synechococcus sp. WH 8016]
MSNELTLANGSHCDQQKSRSAMTLHQGDCIKLRSGEGPFQVIGIDDDHDRCWIRQWPLEPDGSPVFEVALEQISSAISESD